MKKVLLSCLLAVVLLSFDNEKKDTDAVQAYSGKGLCTYVVGGEAARNAFLASKTDIFVWDEYSVPMLEVDGGVLLVYHITYYRAFGGCY